METMRTKLELVTHTHTLNQSSDTQDPNGSVTDHVPLLFTRSTMVC